MTAIFEWIQSVSQLSGGSLFFDLEPGPTKFGRASRTAGVRSTRLSAYPQVYKENRQMQLTAFRYRSLNIQKNRELPVRFLVLHKAPVFRQVVLQPCVVPCLRLAQCCIRFTETMSAYSCGVNISPLAANGRFRSFISDARLRLYPDRLSVKGCKQSPDRFAQGCWPCVGYLASKQLPYGRP